MKDNLSTAIAIFLLSSTLLVLVRADCPVVSPIIYAGQHYETGRVTITATSDTITLQIFGINGWKFDAYHAYVGTNIEQYDGERLKPGQLPYKQEFSNPVSSYTLVIDNHWGCGETLEIAVHTDMIRPQGGREGDARETGWAYGENEFETSWGWYFEYLVCCPDETPDCIGPDGSTIPEGQSKVYYPSDVVPCGQSCLGQARTCTDGVLSECSNSYPSCSVAPCRDCVMPGGTTIPHGTGQNFYESTNVPCGGTCRWERRDCFDGFLSGSFTQTSCSVATCRDCVEGSTTVPHGTSKTFFTSTTVGCLASCRSQTRTCMDGTLSGNATATTCAPVCNPCTPQNGAPMNHGERRDYYESSSVACGEECKVETRECIDGALSGSFNELSCTHETCPTSCTNTPEGPQPIGFQKTYYETPTVACRGTCRSEVRTCMPDGTFSGSFTERDCSVTKCDCTGPGGMNIPHGETRTYYATSSVPCRQTCSQEERECQDGVLLGSFTELACNTGRCPCVGPNGEEMDDGESLDFYQSSTVACGSTCSLETRTCQDGELSGSFEARSCRVNTCPGRDCVAPDGTVMQHGSFETFYQSTSVPCGSSCNSEIRTCTDSVLPGSYTARTCGVEPCNPPPPPPPEPTEPAPPPSGEVCENRYAFFGEIPSLFGVFVFEDFECRNSDTEGRIAAGRDVTIEGYAVACRLYTRENCINFGQITCANLTEEGRWISSIVAGRDVYARNAEIKLGNMAYGGVYNEDATVTFQEDCDLVNQANIIDFAEWKEYLERLSGRIANNLQITGTVSYNTNSRGVILTGTGDSEIDVFELPAEFCGSWNPSDFSIRNVASTASIFVNIYGANLNCGGFSMGDNAAETNPYNMHHVVFNFPEATQLTFHGVTWRGSILAPYATISNPEGRFMGQIFAKSLIGSTICAQQNWEPFEGCIPDYCRNIEPLPYCTATPATWAGCDTAAELTGCLPQDKYFDCLGYDGVTVGCPYDGHTLTLSNIEAAQSYFGQNPGTATGPLDTQYTDPASTPAGGAARELAALALAIKFDQCKSDSMGICSTFGDLYVCDSESCPAFGGKTIGEIFQIANEVVGGCSSSSVTLGQVQTCLRSINEAFAGCRKVTEITSETATFGYCECGVAVCDRMPISLRPNIVDDDEDDDENAASVLSGISSAWLMALLALFALAY